MEKSIENTKKINRAMVIIVVVFTILMIYKNLDYGWEGWMNPIVAACTGLLCLAHFRGVFKPRTESYVISILAIIYLFYYGNHSNVFDFNYPMVLGVYIMASAALDEYPIVIAGVASYFVSFFYQVILAKEDFLLKDKFLPVVIMLSVLIYSRYSIRKHSAEIKESAEGFAKLERERRDREDFLANVSHELRTPVNAITGMADSMLKSDLDEERRKEALSIESAGRRLLRQIEDILDYSELLSDRMQNEKSVYSFGTLFEDIKKVTEQANDQKGLSISYETDSDIPNLLVGDERKIRHCMRNIIENAIKYTEVGSVGIRIFARRESYGVNLTFVVEDTGVGMDGETIEKTYGRYFNTGNEGMLHSDGLKLGLIVSRGLISAMDGFINIDSAPGKGTRVSVTVPQGVESYDSWEKESFAEDESAPDLSGRKVLIVDDEPMNLSVAQRILSTYNPISETADGGTAAVSKCRQSVYDIIFMDHMMPDMDGIEALKIIRGDSTSLNKDTPVIALTANVVSGAREMFLSEGFNEFVAKPIERSFLERAINKICLKPLAAPEPVSEPVAAPEPVSEPVAEALPEPVSEQDKDPISALTNRGVNTQAALTYCADSPDFYLMMLTEFLNSIPGRREELEGFLESEDYDNYRIKVHALKSNSRTLGFDEMSDAALASEEALKAGDKDTAIGMHPDVMEKLSGMEALLKEIL